MTAREDRLLPEGWRWVRLGDVCGINPRRPARLARAADEPTTFIPMSAVDERRGAIAAPGVRPFAEVSKGYTFFQERDVLFAKITPCMQNGKHAIAKGLLGGIGFGTTEFHVIRPLPAVIPEWVHRYLRQPDVLLAASQTFTGAVGQQRVPPPFLTSLCIPLAPLSEQRRIARLLDEQMAQVERARAACQEQLDLLHALIDAYVSQSLAAGSRVRTRLGECLVEVKNGVGDAWPNYPVLGATRSGAAPAKEGVGKAPDRYKLVEAGTIFYNPMRILIGSIAMIESGQPPGVTSPDYVVFKCREGAADPTWFYYWLRSSHGAQFVKTLARGAVRERLLFRRLSSANATLPTWEVQVRFGRRLQALSGPLRLLSEQKDLIEALPASLLRRAFRGEL